jgi:hypothetical protein
MSTIFFGAKSTARNKPTPPKKCSGISTLHGFTPSVLYANLLDCKFQPDDILAVDLIESLVARRACTKMRGLNLKPSRVYQTASLLLETQSISQPPPWFNTIRAVPPGEIMTRTQPVQHRAVNPKMRIRKPSKMFKPQLIEYDEDRLRRTFYSDHPWELARPRIVLENDGKDGQRCDWSHIQQPGRPLNGERYCSFSVSAISL